MQKKELTFFGKWKNLFSSPSEKVSILGAVMIGFVLAKAYMLSHNPKNQQKIREELIKKVILVTGCGSGFGYELAKRLHYMGYTVIATCHRQESVDRLKNEINSHQFHAMKLDVTKEQMILHVKGEVEKILNQNKGYKLWGIVNNAGVVYPGYFEMVPNSLMLTECDCMWAGPSNIVSCLLPLIYGKRENIYNIDQNGSESTIEICGCDGGRIVDVTSRNTHAPRALLTSYGSNKVALSDLTKCWNDEFSPRFGIWCAVVEPGTCSKTNLMTSAVKNFKKYDELRNHDKGMELDDNKMEPKRTLEMDDNQISELYEVEVFKEEFCNLVDTRNDVDGDLTPCIDSIIDALTSNYPQEVYTIGEPNTPRSKIIDIY